MIHFQGWSPKFDEWIDADSYRIKAHNLYTNPCTKDPREQEEWQGLYGITTKIKSAFINHKGKKGGSIKIDYKTLDQLEMITQKLKN